MKRLVTALFLAACLVPAASAATPDNLQVHDAWIRWLPGKLPMAGYFRLTNTGKQAAILTNASSAAYTRVMLHRSQRINGQESMQHVNRIIAAPGKTLVFAPGGNHLMLMERRQEIAVGDHITIRLHFADGTTVPVTFEVRGAAE